MSCGRVAGWWPAVAVVTTGVALAFSPLLALTAVAVVFGWWTGEWGTAVVFARLSGLALVAFAGPYLLHECGHLIAIRWCRQVTPVRARWSLARVSLTARGELSRSEAVAVALAGPLSCVVLGGALLAAHLPTLAMFSLAHVLFLLPVFGDGRSALTALRA